MKSLECVRNNLVFIVGCSRSGTTLLKSILNEHYDVFIPPETFYFSNIAKNGKKIVEKNKKIEYLLSHWWIRGMINEVNFKDSAKDVINDWDEIYLHLLRSTSSKKNIKVFGEKTPQHIMVADQLLENFPGSKIIHVIRDPRAVFYSFSSIALGTNQVSSVVDEWKGVMEMHKKLKDSTGYHYVKYENLVSNPSREIESMCNFIGIKYSEVLLDYYRRSDDGYFPEQTHHENTLKPIFNSSIDKWREGLKNRDIAILELYLGELMSENGYNLTGAVTKFAHAKYQFSRIYDLLSKIFLRKPRQWVKKMKAMNRLKK